MFKKLMASLITTIGTLAANTSGIVIVKTAEIEALNAAERGIVDYLEALKMPYKSETCQGNAALAAQILSKYANNEVDVVVTIGTMPSQVSAKLVKEGRLKNLVFAAVTDPASFRKKNITGVSDYVLPKPQLKIFKEIQPNLKRLGVIYNTGEANSVAIIKEMRKAARECEIELIEQGIQKSSDIPQATNALAAKVDAIFINNDNTALCGISLIISICNKYQIPVYVSDTDEVEKGCVAALGPNQYELGKQAGKMIEKIKNGTNINDIKIEYPDRNELFINLEAAEKIGLKISKEVLAKADKIIGNAK
ncbi:MAG: ABC transporter substrate-binding protein [Holosporales bacterium]|jgi:putative ABC transport system substrate-binding protein|nr:ABC transporter substrate-binding protein [Holosporales bacterium]